VVRLCNPVHPLNGKVLTLRYFIVVGSSKVAAVQHPDGGTLLLPERWLVPFEEAIVSKMSCGALFDPARLLTLASRIEGMRRREDEPSK